MKFSRLEKSAADPLHANVNHFFKTQPDRLTAMSRNRFFNHNIPKTKLSTGPNLNSSRAFESGYNSV